MHLPTTLPLLLTLLITPISAQFGFFDQMFGGGGQGGGSHQHHHHQQPQNVRSDSAWYQQQYESAHCSNYLCPGTLSCVHFPHHCPCAWDQEEKVELGDGVAVCASRGGWSEGETQRKIELARKGLL